MKRSVSHSFFRFACYISSGPLLRGNRRFRQTDVRHVFDAVGTLQSHNGRI
jgi:hypothetical protein